MAIEEVSPEYRYSRGYESSATPVDVVFSCGCTIVIVALLLAFFLIMRACGGLG